MGTNINAKPFSDMILTQSLDNQALWSMLGNIKNELKLLSVVGNVDNEIVNLQFNR